MRVALVCDLLEEQWPSMDLVAEMTYSCLQKHGLSLNVSQLRPSMRHRLSRFPWVRSGSFARNFDRLLNRFWDYPRWLRIQSEAFEVFHVMDHSYAQLIHHLPPERTVVSCHDLDAFKCILNPPQEKRSLPFRLMSTRILSGLAKASRILCDSQTVRDELVSYGVVPPERICVVFHGTHPTCSPIPDRDADAEADRLLNISLNPGYLLHVGSTIPRKNIEHLLRVFADVRRSLPDLQLVRVGGPFTAPQQALALELGVFKAVIVLPRLDRRVLASVYRRANLLVLPSTAEGFGLPLVEALASGCPVLASDIAVLREIGGDVTTFCQVGKIASWSQNIINLLHERVSAPATWDRRRSLGSAWAARFSWEQSAARCVQIYKEVLERHL